MERSCSLHEPGAQYTGKGKDRIRYEFGNKSVIVTTNCNCWIVNAEDLPDNPYDGHTLNVSITGAEKIPTSLRFFSTKNQRPNLRFDDFVFF